ncbi:MAG: Rieske 2Fe-2S domain-containing protein [Dehalococcoidia bacterium]
MLTQQENELLTRVGPGTPMGNTLRRYWIPAMLSWELLEPDCPPVRLRLLGESLVAFRDSHGRIGIVEEFCPHRRVSLWLGRNEEDGLRCIYHGWKFDVDGNCVDMMNEPDSLNFKNKVHLQSYPALELGGVIWTYMGPAELRPDPPAYEWLRAPETHRHASKVVEECNWLQCLEGGIDSSHAPILHRKLRDDVQRGGLNPSTPFVQGKAPVLTVETTDYGYRYFGVRPLDGRGSFVRGYHFVMPFTQMRPGERRATGDVMPGHFWVPMDDHTTMVWNWEYSTGAELTEDDRLQSGTGNGPDDVDYANGFRSYRNMRNDWMIDRWVQRHETFSGIEGINAQDRAVQESMGPIIDRSREHLGPADKAIIEARKLLMQALRTVQDGGDPAGTKPTYKHARAAEAVFPADVDWHAGLMAAMYPAAASGNA